MRHLNKGRSLSRSPSHRKAVLANLAQELFLHKRIRTTLIKAKELRPYAEKLVTAAKKGNLAARRQVLQRLSRTSIVKTLFEEIAPKFADRNGGYTRIIRLGQRIGDSAPLAIIELVGYEGIVKQAEEKKADAEKTAKKAAAKKREATKKSPKEPKEAKPAEKSKAKPRTTAKPSAKKKSGATKGKPKSGDRG